METCNENENVIRRLFQGGLQTFTAPDSKRRSHLIITFSQQVFWTLWIMFSSIDLWSFWCQTLNQIYWRTEIGFQQSSLKSKPVLKILKWGLRIHIGIRIAIYSQEIHSSHISRHPDSLLLCIRVWLVGNVPWSHAGHLFIWALWHRGFVFRHVLLTNRRNKDTS